MPKIILAIDDDAARYDDFRSLLAKRNGSTAELRIASCEACVLAQLQVADVILLDYDLDGRDWGWHRLCPLCEISLPERAKGIEYVPEIAETKKPVLVVSASYPENVDRLIAKLKAYDVQPLARHSANEIMPEYAWITTLWTWGIL